MLKVPTSLEVTLKKYSPSVLQLPCSMEVTVPLPRYAQSRATVGVLGSITVSLRHGIVRWLLDANGA